MFFFPSAILAVALVAVSEPSQAVQPDRQIPFADAGAKSDVVEAVPTLTITRKPLCSGTISPFQYGQFIEYLCGLTLSMRADQVEVWTVCDTAHTAQRHAANSWHEPNRIRTVRSKATLAGNTLKYTFPPLSVTLLEIKERLP